MKPNEQRRHDSRLFFLQAASCTSTCTLSTTSRPIHRPSAAPACTPSVHVIIVLCLAFLLLFLFVAFSSQENACAPLFFRRTVLRSGKSRMFPHLLSLPLCFSFFGRSPTLQVESFMYFAAALICVPFGCHPAIMLGCIIDCAVGMSPLCAQQAFILTNLFLATPRPCPYTLLFVYSSAATSLSVICVVRVVRLSSMSWVVTHLASSFPLGFYI